jgi:alpha-galactosidase
MACDAWLALRDPSLDEGMFMGWEWSGVFTAEVGDFLEGPGAYGVRLGFSDGGDYYRELAPGESFTSPVAFFGFFSGDVEEAGRTTRRVAEKVFGLPWPEGRPPMFVGYDTWSNWDEWEGGRNHLRAERFPREIERAAELGVELFIVDYDWFPWLGDWWSDPARFPEAIGHYSRQIKAAGMKMGLWMGFGSLNYESQVAQEHPEWLVMRDNQPYETNWIGPRVYLCLAVPEARDWIIEQISRVVEEFEVDWLKHDFLLVPRSDGRHQCPHARDTRIETVEGYYHVMEELHRRFPRLYLDNWVPNHGGIDYGNLQRHHSMLTADRYDAVSVRSSYHGVTHLVPPGRTHLYPRAGTPHAERSPYHYRSGFFGNGMIMLNDILKWDEEMVARVQERIAEIKADREVFREGVFYNLIDKQPDHWGWEARFCYSEAQGRGVAQVFRNHDPRDEYRLRFRGLKAGTRYSVSLVDAGVAEQASAEELMESGLTLRLAAPFTSELVRISRRV